MMTVRFPDGTSIQYNSARSVGRSAHGYTDLYDSSDEKNRRWIAQVPNSCVTEVQPPCRVYNALLKGEQIRNLAQHMRELASYDYLHALANLKKQLQAFNAKTRRWK